MSFQIIRPELSGHIRGVLFDMDGVILDSEKLYARFWAEACSSFGYTMTYQQALGMRSLNRDAGQAYLSSLFGEKIVYTDVRAKRIELMNEYVEQNGVEAKPGIYELLDYLNENKIPCAVTTASPMDRIQDHLGRLDLFHRFNQICTAYQVPHGKPEPDIYLFGAQSIGISPENCIALEDSYTGMLSAYRAGCKAVIVPDLDQPDDKILSIAYGCADSLNDVIGMIKENVSIQ